MVDLFRAGANPAPTVLAMGTNKLFGETNYLKALQSLLR